MVFLKDEKILGLKIDVDTFRGTKVGVPNLLELLLKYNLKGSFFLSIGKDNMGRHAWRLLKPKFLLKMLRGNAAKLYGWDIIFKGFLWSGPDISKNLYDIGLNIKKLGHEIGLHALDHYKWQMKIKSSDKDFARYEMQKANEIWNDIFGELPQTAANPGWQLSESWLQVSDELYKGQLLYRSDARGNDYGYPVFNSIRYNTIQIPTTLPTFDEVIGKNGINERNYNDFILSKIKPGKLNVISIHAEVEGIAYIDLFEDFIKKCANENIKIVTLKNIYDKIKNTDKTVNIVLQEIDGREGKLALVK